MATMSTWALQDAKAKFSAMVEMACRQGPQVVTRYGEEAVVVVAAKQFRQLTRRHGREDLVHFFQSSPLTELNPEWLQRQDDHGREVAL